MKKIMIISLIILSVFLIYLCNLDRKVYYLALNDLVSDYPYSKYVKNYLKEKDVLEIYVDNYSQKNLTMIDLQRKINDNEKINKEGKEITLKNALIKADLITLSFSNQSILNKVDNPKVYDYIDEFSNDLDRLLKTMREYCKEDIIFIGYYAPNEESLEVIKYLNKEYAKVCQRYNVEYIDLVSIFENRSEFIDNNNLPTRSGENMIASKVIDRIDKKLLKG